MGGGLTEDNMRELRLSIEHENLLGSLIKKYFLDNKEVLELSLSPDKHFSLRNQTQLQDKVLSRQRMLSLPEKQQIKRQNDELQEHQESVQNVDVLPKLEVADISPQIPRTGYTIESIKKVPTMFVEDQFNGLSHFRLYMDVSDISEGLLPYVNILELLFGQLGTKTLRYDDFNESLSQVADEIKVSTLKTLHPSEEGRFLHHVCFQVSCLDRNIDQTLRLLAMLLTEPDFADKERISQIVQMVASDLSGALVEDAIQHAINSSAIGFDFLGSRSNPYSDTQFFLNFAKNCLKSNQLPMMLEDLAFHLDFLLKKLFRKGKLKIMVHSDKANKKTVGRELKRMLSALEQNYFELKSEDKARASKSKQANPRNPNIVFSDSGRLRAECNCQIVCHSKQYQLRGRNLPCPRAPPPPQPRRSNTVRVDDLEVPDSSGSRKIGGLWCRLHRFVSGPSLALLLPGPQCPFNLRPL